MINLSKMYSPDKHEMDGVFMYQFPQGAFEGISNPVIQVDHFYMSTPHFPPHPHAGFSAVTYMLEDSKGAFLNRDSHGDQSIISAGDLHWTWAGNGILHEETPTINGVICHGLQIFVNMSAANKLKPAQIWHLTNENQPIIDDPAIKIKVVVGSEKTTQSPVQTPDAFSLLDLQFKQKASYEHSVLQDWGGLILGIKGRVAISAGTDKRSVSANEGVAFATSDKPGLITVTGDTDSYCVILTGQQIKETLVASGPFVMNTREQITATIERYQSGKMGTLSKSF